MRAKPSVSVIVPTFQRRELVRRAVASVLAQTYRDFELVVVDDGSTDGTGAALAPLGDRIAYHWQPNAGVSAARNAGLRLASAPIVAFLDSDNRWLPDHLEVVTGVLGRRPESVLASTCPRFVVGGREGPGDARVDGPSVPLLTRVRVGHLSCVAVRRAALDEVGGFDERMPAYEDIDLWARLALLGPFATVRRRTIVRQATAGSLRDRARLDGSYLVAAELSAAGVVAAAERGAGGAAAGAERSAGDVLAEARGALHLARAVRAVDRGDAAAAGEELARACRLAPLDDLPEEAEAPFRRHLTRTDRPTERLRALRTVADAWPDRRADTARFVRLLAVAAAVRAGRPRDAIALLGSWPARGTLPFARRLAPVAGRRAVRSWQESRHRASEDGESRAAAFAQRVVRRTGAGPLRPAWGAAYELIARAAGLYLRRGIPDAGVYVRGSFAAGDPVHGVSDLDLAVLVREAAEQAAVEARWQRLQRRAPLLAGSVVDRPKILDDAGLSEILAATTLTHGLDGAIVPSERERRRAGHRSERPGLYGPLTLRDWRHLAGGDRRPDVEPWDQAGRRISAWLELQFWWMQAFRACAAPQRPWAAAMCVKLMLEPLRISLWLEHGERVRGRRELAERVRVRLAEESDTVDAALRLGDGLHLGPEPPLGAALGALVRTSERLASMVEQQAAEEAFAEVRLAGEAPPPRPADGPGAHVGGGGAPLPLADWRGIVWPPSIDETFVLGDADPADPAQLADLAPRCGDGTYVALAADGLLVLPSITGARLRAVQCAVTDPVSFALAEGRSRARFAEIPGWRVADVARRAVAEHLGWLRSADRPLPRERLLGAVRAAMLLESAEAGDPELLLTGAAVAERLGAGGADLLQAVLERPCYRT